MPSAPSASLTRASDWSVTTDGWKLNSTPYTIRANGGAELNAGAMADLLYAMARAALMAAESDS